MWPLLFCGNGRPRNQEMQGVLDRRLRSLHGITKAALQQLVKFAAESLEGQVGKRVAVLGAWSEGASPAAAAKCRRLGRSPTGPPLTQ